MGSREQTLSKSKTIKPFDKPKEWFEEIHTNL